jgi:hypothetical protein
MSQEKHDAIYEPVKRVLRALGYPSLAPMQLARQVKEAAAVGPVLALPIDTTVVQDIQDADGNWLYVTNTQAVTDDTVIG